MPFSDPEKRKGYHAEYNKECSLKDNPSILRKAADYLENQLLTEKASLELAVMFCGLCMTQEAQNV